MGDLSRNFSRSEFTCRCGEVIVSPDLVLLLQGIRDRVNRSVVINSGYRCEEHNREVGGVRNSRHLLGEAADIFVPGMSGEELLGVVRELYQQGRVYVGYAYQIKGSTRAVHVDVRRPPSVTVKKWR